MRNQPNRQQPLETRRTFLKSTGTAVAGLCLTGQATEGAGHGVAAGKESLALFGGAKAVTHRRAIAFLKPEVFVVFDTCNAEADGHTLSWHFHSPTELVVQPGGRVVSVAGPGVLLAGDRLGRPGQARAPGRRQPFRGADAALRPDRADTLVFGSGRALTLLDGRLVTDGQFAWIREQGGVRRGRVAGGEVLTWEGRAVKAMD